MLAKSASDSGSKRYVAISIGWEGGGGNGFVVGWRMIDPGLRFIEVWYVAILYSKGQRGAR